MKALIISDKQDVTNLLSENLKNDGFDIIVYRWFLKALDNIEEIKPDYIVLNVEEYPRHWKTLASFIQSGIGGNDIRLCLYNFQTLNDEDKSKAEQLGVEFYYDKKVTEDTIEDVAEVDTVEEESVPTVDTIVNNQIEIGNNIYSVIITNPVTNKFVYGKAEKLSFDTFECETENENFEVDQVVKYVTICNDDNCISFTSEVLAISSNKVMIKVLRYYEN